MVGAKKPFEWDDARVLLALFRHRTLRDAAAQLQVNASTVRRRLDMLESALSTRLFDRTPTGVEPTSAAALLLPYAEQLEHAALGLVTAAHALEDEPEGLVRITAAPGVAEHFVAPAIPRLLERYPHLRIDLDSSIEQVDLVRGDADLALRTRRPAGGDLIAQKLLASRDAVLGAPSYVRQLGRVSSLTQARWITWGEELAQLPSVRWIVERVPARAIVLRTSNINGLLNAAESGVGLLLISEDNRAFRQVIAAELSPELAHDVAALPTLSLWLVSRRAVRDVPRIAAVRRFLVAEMARLRSLS